MTNDYCVCVLILDISLDGRKKRTNDWKWTDEQEKGRRKNW